MKWNLKTILPAAAMILAFNTAQAGILMPNQPTPEVSKSMISLIAKDTIKIDGQVKMVNDHGKFVCHANSTIPRIAECVAAGIIANSMEDFASDKGLSSKLPLDFKDMIPEIVINMVNENDQYIKSLASIVEITAQVQRYQQFDGPNGAAESDYIKEQKSKNPMLSTFINEIQSDSIKSSLRGGPPTITNSTFEKYISLGLSSVLPEMLKTVSTDNPLYDDAQKAMKELQDLNTEMFKPSSENFSM